MPRTAEPLDSRLSRFSTHSPETGCLMWLGKLNNFGYGMMTVAGTARLAHRVAYEVHVGPIPDGLVLDHLCRDRACVNPAHLEPVTMAENVHRSPIAPAAVNARKTHCPQGHPYFGANLYIVPSNGWRYCRACMNAAVTARRRLARLAVSR